MAQRRWSDQEILDALQIWAKQHGRSPTWSDWAKAADDHPTSVTVWTRCGSWVDALEIAGLEPARNGDQEQLGVHHKALGPKPPRKPRNAAERRELRIEALKRALEKEKRSG